MVLGGHTTSSPKHKCCGCRSLFAKVHNAFASKESDAFQAPISLRPYALLLALRSLLHPAIYERLVGHLRDDIHILRAVISNIQGLTVVVHHGNAFA
eukprot:2578856-Amphidinium_carterae.2